MSFVETAEASERVAGTGVAGTGDAGTGRLHSIGEAARRAGVSVRALRYYDEMGLVRPAGHSPGGHRLYGAAELARVARIRELQDLMGFNLAEIGELLRSEDRLDSLREAFHRDEDPQRRLGIASEALSVLGELEGRIAAKRQRLDEFSRSIGERRARVEALLEDGVAGDDRITHERIRETESR